MGHDLVSALIDLLAWVQRSYVDFGAVPVFDPFWSSVVYFFGLLSLPFGAARQARARRWLLAVPLIALELYFIHNRLTLFSNVQLTRASLLGNVAILALGVVFMLPIEIWARLPRRRENDAGLRHDA